MKAPTTVDPQAPAASLRDTPGRDTPMPGSAMADSPPLHAPPADASRPCAPLAGALRPCAPPAGAPRPDAPTTAVDAARGHHWLLDLSGCGCDAELLQRANGLRELCLRACRDAGMTVVGDAFHQFEPQGVTGVVLLAESHLSIHTWPEVAFAAVDVYVCDHAHGNAARGQALAQAIEQALRPRQALVRDVARQSIPHTAA